MFVPTDEQIENAVQSLIKKLHYIIGKMFKRSTSHFFVTQWIRIETPHEGGGHKGTIIDVRICVVDDPAHQCCIEAAAESLPGFLPDGTRVIAIDEHEEQPTQTH